MNAPKISVIVPIYNVEKYLDKCLVSIRSQTFKDIEIICIDDCSPDNSHQIVEKHAKEDKRIVFIRHEKNLGLGGARNTAIRIAKADYLASVDSDDYILPNMLEILWNETDNGWFDIVCCGYQRVDEKGNVLSKVTPLEIQAYNNNNDVDIFSIIPPAFWNKIWRKSLFIDNNIFFPEHDYYEDMSTTPRLVAKSKYIKVVKDSLYCYLIRDGSIMGSFSDKHIIDYFKGFEILFNFLQEQKLEEHYQKEFSNYVKGNLFYYAKLILGSKVTIDKKTQYLRFLVLFRITFIENFQYFKGQDLNGLLQLLNEDSLHGKFFNEKKQALVQVGVKQGFLDKQLEEIERRGTTIQSLRDALNIRERKTQLLSVNLKAEKQEVVMLLDAKKEENIQLTTRLNIVSNDWEIERKALQNTNVRLQNTNVSLQTRVSLLEEEVSLMKMIAVLSYALIAASFMTEKQTLKLINKPKMFFRDSKSGFAKKYASWFNII